MNFLNCFNKKLKLECTDIESNVFGKKVNLSRITNKKSTFYITPRAIIPPFYFPQHSLEKKLQKINLISEMFKEGTFQGPSFLNLNE